MWAMIDALTREHGRRLKDEEYDAIATQSGGTQANAPIASEPGILDESGGKMERMILENVGRMERMTEAALSRTVEFLSPARNQFWE